MSEETNKPKLVLKQPTRDVRISQNVVSFALKKAPAKKAVGKKAAPKKSAR